MAGHIDHVSLPTNTQHDHILLLEEFLLSDKKDISASNLRNLNSCVRRCNIELSTLGMFGGSQPHQSCNPCKTYGYVMTAGWLQER